MVFPKKEEVQNIRAMYPEGTKVRLVYMDDKQAPPKGTIGIVKGVDDTGSLMVSWATGSSLHVILNEDIVEKVS